MDAFFKEEQKKLKALKLSKLKKVGKAREVAEEVMEASIAGVADEDDAKDILIGLIFKAMCLKVAPSPSRERSPKEEDLAMQTCQLCTGCIRFPGHDGPCMDGQCNEIYPDRTDVVTLDMAEEAAAKHREMTQAIMQKLEQKAQEAEEAAAAAARKQAEAEEAARKAAEELKQAEEAARRKAEEDAAAAAAAAAEAAAASAAAEEAAKEAQAKREAQRRAIEREENEMADLCVKTFLGCIRTSKRIHTPIEARFRLAQ
eukprot:TRINITY_DN2970_c1_g3_i1.p1 TRINITY_DN2970_c1_g3~~TRINITY_DN2970_c1_g3_i1.p1  ORF type:complete len:258 (-),score=109.97 TRINITY_DN2970_c1_g3_i1:98-871(-)